MSVYNDFNLDKSTYVRDIVYYIIGLGILSISYFCNISLWLNYIFNKFHILYIIKMNIG